MQRVEGKVTDLKAIRCGEEFGSRYLGTLVDAIRPVLLGDGYE